MYEYNDTGGLTPMSEGEWKNPGTSGGGFDSFGMPQTYNYDANPWGQASDNDPFAYTQGSLLTPWTQKFDSSQYGSGGGGYAPMEQFSYQDFAGPSAVGAYDAPSAVPGITDPVSLGRYSAASQFGDFTPLSDVGPAQQIGTFTGRQDIVGPEAYGSFILPTGQQALEQDPGYQFRLNQGLDAIQNASAARGLLRSGATLKGLSDYAQNSASQEYANAVQRALGTYTTNRDTAGFNLGNTLAVDAANRGAAENAFGLNMNAAQANNQANLARELENRRAYEAAYGMNLNAAQFNEANRMGAFQQNQGALQMENQNRMAAEQARINAQAQAEAQRLAAYDANLGATNLNYQMQAGTYDRNLQNYLTALGLRNQDAQNAAGASASAANAEYQRALADYNRDYGIFRDNQAWQYGVMRDMQGDYERALAREAGYGADYAGAGMQNAYNQGNANAAGLVGSANAWNQAISGAGSSALDAYGGYLYGRG